MKNRCTTVLRALAGLLLIATLAACSTTLPAGRFDAFRASSTEISETSSSTYARIEKRQRDFVVMTAPDHALTKDTFKPVDGKGDSIDIGPALQKREAALNVLVNYANTLASLAGKDFATEVDKSAQDLAGSLLALDGASGGGAASNAFAAVVDLVARSVTDSMRKDALKKAMDLGQPGIDAITKLLHQSNSRISAFTSIMRDRYLAHAQADRPAFGTFDRYQFDLKVAETMAEFEEIDNALVTASAALDKLPQAHREIRMSLDNRAQPLVGLQAMIHESQRLRAFYRSLPTK